MSSGEDHAAIGAHESAGCEPTAWERWIGDVETVLGHSADGDQSADGYSLDGLYALWERGATVTDAVAHVRAQRVR